MSDIYCAQCEGRIVGGHVLPSMVLIRELLEALEATMDIMRYYHKGEVPGDLDACESPDNCGHCLAMRKARAATAKARGM